MILTGAVMWLVAKSRFGFTTELPFTAEIGTVFIALGVIVIATGLTTFARLGTTVNPLDLTETTRLVTQGIYKFSRNPMYVGLTCILIGWGFHLGSPVNVLCVAAFVVVIDRWQIKPEEAALRGLFGKQYEVYCRRVRRWV